MPVVAENHRKLEVIIYDLQSFSMIDLQVCTNITTELIKQLLSVSLIL